MPLDTTRIVADDEFARIADGEERRAIDTLTLAFADDPVIRWMYPEAQRFLHGFPRFLAAFGGASFDEQTAYRLGDFAAAALWMPPGVAPDADDIVAAVFETVDQEKHADFLAVAARMDAAHPTFRHWYLPWFGVDSALQNRGVGARLMRRCLDFVDAAHLPAYLESPNPKNLPFYRRFGFEVIGEAQVGACPPVFFMLRDAR